MSDGTHIEWTDATWNPITGCSVVSPGCANCYAMKLAGTRLKDIPSRHGLTRASKAGPVWTGEVRLNEAWLDQPLRWRRPRRIFVCAHGDLFHESVPNAWIDRVFAVMALAPHHQFQVLTKRASTMRDYVTGFGDDEHGAAWRTRGRVQQAMRLVDGDAQLRQWPPPNVWLGVSVEDQARADERIPDLLATPAAVRWISAEPLLGPIDLDSTWHGESALTGDCWGDCRWCTKVRPPLWNCRKQDGATLYPHGRSGLDWVVVGGESGRGARPMHPDWARSLRDQCALAGVPFLFKQWGEWAPGENATNTVGRAVETADWFDGEWDYQRLTAAQADAMTAEDEPTLYRAGKKAAGRLLDGVLHDGFPGAAA
jgi:protein gp37